MGSILVIEDERLLGRSIQESLGDNGHEVHWVRLGEQALDWLTDRHVDLVLADLRLPGIDGLEVLEQITRSHPGTSVIMMTAHGDVDIAVQAMKRGASDFLAKPIDLDAISLLAERSLDNRRRTQSWKHEQKNRSQDFGLHQIIGECPEIGRAKTIVRRIAGLEVAASEQVPKVFITGETGTGKDLFARALHYEGPRRDGQFVQINCAALPTELVESELFGHTKGAFTDARSSKRGLFDIADGGTLFLDEIGSLPLALQAKVLTAIETGRIRPLGAVAEKRVNVHLVAAMNQDPQKQVREGRFREDLYHRLRVVHIHLPPLRDRGLDVQVLADHFLRMHCQNFGVHPKRLTPEARRLLGAYRWPGNVRELQHRLESAVLLSEEVIDGEFLPNLRRDAPRPVDPQHTRAIAADFSSGPISLEAVERDLLARAMGAARENVSKAAELLCVSRDTMRYRLEKHGIPHKRNGEST